MRVRRGLLFAGLFLIPVGAMTLLVDAGTIDPMQLTDLWRLWPLILVGFGVALLLGRTGFGAVGTGFAALILGVIVGGAIASGGNWIGSFTDCGPGMQAGQSLDKSGTFTGSATVDLQLRCGSVTMTTGPSNEWSVAARYEGPPPNIDASPDSLRVTVPEGIGVRHEDWTVTTPASQTSALRLTSNAATADVTLDGATLHSVEVDANAGDILVNGGSATIDSIDLSVNAGRARVTLAGTVSGDLSVNAGAIDLCVPPNATLNLDVNDQLTFVTNLASRGMTRSGETWQRAGSAGGGTIDLQIEGNAASFTLDPDGGCR